MYLPPPPHDAFRAWRDRDKNRVPRRAVQPQHLKQDFQVLLPTELSVELSYVPVLGLWRLLNKFSKNSIVAQTYLVRLLESGLKQSRF